MEFLGSTAPIPANMLAERVGTKTESHGLETWPQPQKFSQSRKSTHMFPWLKTRGCEVTLQLTTYMFQVAEIIGTWDAGQHTHILLNLSHPVSQAFNFFFEKTLHLKLSTVFFEKTLHLKLSTVFSKKPCIWSFQLVFRQKPCIWSFQFFFRKKPCIWSFQLLFRKKPCIWSFQLFFRENLASEAFN